MTIMAPESDRTTDQGIVERYRAARAAQADAAAALVEMLDLDLPAVSWRLSDLGELDVVEPYYLVGLIARPGADPDDARWKALKMWAAAWETPIINPYPEAMPETESLMVHYREIRFRAGDVRVRVWTPLSAAPPEESAPFVVRLGELTEAQADGLACVVCPASYLTSSATHVPVGTSPTGSQVFACAPCCAARITSIEDPA